MQLLGALPVQNATPGTGFPFSDASPASSIPGLNFLAILLSGFDAPAQTATPEDAATTDTEAQPSPEAAEPTLATALAPEVAAPEATASDPLPAPRRAPAGIHVAVRQLGAAVPIATIVSSATPQPQENEPVVGVPTANPKEQRKVAHRPVMYIGNTAALAAPQLPSTTPAAVETTAASPAKVTLRRVASSTTESFPRVSLEPTQPDVAIAAVPLQVQPQREQPAPVPSGGGDCELESTPEIAAAGTAPEAGPAAPSAVKRPVSRERVAPAERQQQPAPQAAVEPGPVDTPPVPKPAPLLPHQAAVSPQDAAEPIPARRDDGVRRPERLAVRFTPGTVLELDSDPIESSAPPAASAPVILQEPIGPAEPQAAPGDGQQPRIFSVQEQPLAPLPQEVQSIRSASPEAQTAFALKITVPEAPAPSADPEQVPALPVEHLAVRRTPTTATQVGMPPEPVSEMKTTTAVEPLQQPEQPQLVQEKAIPRTEDAPRPLAVKPSRTGLQIAQSQSARKQTSQSEIVAPPPAATQERNTEPEPARKPRRSEHEPVVEHTAAVTSVVELRGDATDRRAPQPAEAAPRQVSAPEASDSVREVAPPVRESHKTTPLREITLRVPGAEERSVDLRVVANRGAVHVEVKTADSHLASSLRESVGDLVGRLDQSGYRAEEVSTAKPEAVSITGAGAAQQTNTETGQQGHSQSGDGMPGHGQGGQQQQQHGQGRGNRPRWLEEIVRNFDPTASEKEQQD